MSTIFMREISPSQFNCSCGNEISFPKDRLLSYYNGEIKSIDVHRYFNNGNVICMVCTSKANKVATDNRCKVCGVLITPQAIHCSDHKIVIMPINLNPVIGYRRVKSKIKFVSGGAVGTGKKR